MLDWLWLVPALPFAGFVLLAVAGGHMRKGTIAVIGAGSVGLAALVAILIAVVFLSTPPEGHTYQQVLWTWVHVGDFAPQVALRLDALSLIMTLVVTFVGFWIHLYSTEFMQADEGYRRYFAYMNLFVGSMLSLVLADNLLLLYLGWEGVGLCSYLLIGFWYKDPANTTAACKAFIVTRVGDVSLMIALFLIYRDLGTLQFHDALLRAADRWPPGSGPALAAAALLFGGAVGKSAQLPLQTWLPDAMAGPTPVSALIHAATMVTAGVYLIARTHVIFVLAPPVQTAVAIVGAATLLLAGCSALVQWDMKRVLAYSTISQIGYMFLALGVGAWSAAMFHFLTHAFFKALLFLGAGVVIEALNDEHNIFRMGALRKSLPVTFWTFLIGSASLAALPLVTAGFYSKDLILWESWASPSGSVWLWVAGAVGAFLTAVYTFRMVFVAFFGEAKQAVVHRPGYRMTVPLVVLAIFAFGAGFLNLPETLGNAPFYTNFLSSALPAPGTTNASIGLEVTLQIVAAVLSLSGILVAGLFYLRWPGVVAAMTRSAPLALVHAWWFADWGFDWLYDTLLVRPYVWMARVNKGDFVDLIYQAVAGWTMRFHYAMSETQTGRLRWYAMGITIGAVIILAFVVFQ